MALMKAEVSLIRTEGLPVSAEKPVITATNWRKGVLRNPKQLFIHL
jgi:hypothetical protein